MSVIQFNILSEEEKATLFHSPAIVAYLIGGADNKFDDKEIAQAKHVVNLRNNTGDPILFDFYSAIVGDFDNQLKQLIDKHQNLETSVRTQLLSDELIKLNEILPKIDSIYARAFVKSLKSLAKEVAEASGGFLGMLEISYEEKQLLGLEMINYES